MSAHMLLVACSLLAQADETVKLADIKLELPKSVAGLAFKERKDFDVKELGYGVSYGNRRCNVNLYIYDHGVEKIPDGKLGPAVDAELKVALGDIAAAEKQGVMANVERLKGDLPLPMPVLAKFATAGFTFDLKGKPCKSYLLLAGRSSKFVKIRFTQYVIDGETNDEELAEFLATVAKLLD